MAQSKNWRPQPPSLSDPEANDFDLEYVAGEDEAGAIEQDTDGIDEDASPRTGRPKPPNWLKRAKDAFEFSTTYVDSNYRKKWEDSIRAFNNQHAGDSKYNSEVFSKRSKYYRPKSRAITRKNEAAAAAAYFSNLDLVDVQAENEAIKEERISSELMKHVLEYRLKKSIPWFQIVTGGIQDCHKQGAALAHVYWDFMEKYDENGIVTAKKDTPCCDLVPMENMRIDPSASWIDPIGTSPYLIHMIPMYWGDVQERMRSPDPKGRTWKKIEASVAFGRSNNPDDSTRQTRLGGQQDPAPQKREVSDYDIVWVHRHIHRYQGEDWQFYTLASERMLTDPEPLSDTVWHGQRPYVLGKIEIQTHVALPDPFLHGMRGLQEESNEMANQTADNVKFVLNKGYKVKRGKNVDVSSLVRNVPGRITMMDDPETDVIEEQWQDVTQSAFIQQDRIDSDFNDVAGNFSPMQVQTQRTPRESTTTHKMLQAPANLMTEYLLLVFNWTFIEPVLRQIVMLEQHYETDHTVLALAGDKAKLVQKYGMNEVTDEMLNRELTLTVNVGMGATDPVTKFEKFSAAVLRYAQAARLQPPGLDLKEVWKEFAALSGYQQGARFMIDGTDPQVAKLTQENQQLKMKLMQLAIEKKNKDGANVVKLQANRETQATKVLIESMKHGDKGKDRDHSNRQLLAQHIMDLSKGEIDAQHQAESDERNRQASPNAA